MLFVITDNHDDTLKIERLYKKYRVLMFGKANAILNDNDLAEDAVQESFVRVINNLHKIDENNCPRTRSFLVIISENIAKNMYNKNKRIVSFDEEIDSEDLTANDLLSDDPINFVVSTETFNELLKVIESLPPTIKDVFLLKTSHNCNLSEIAALLSIPFETVKKRLYRGRKMLSEYLRKEAVKIEHG